MRGGSHAKRPVPCLPFQPTEFSSAEDKAVFGNTLLHFIDSEWKQGLFTKKFYARLSMTFGHIAHYNIQGFYETWFTNDPDRLRFLRTTLRWPCHGDPKFTFSDVERELQRVISSRGYLAIYEQRASDAVRSAELALLAKLQAKYGDPMPIDRAKAISDVSQTIINSAKVELQARELFNIEEPAPFFDHARLPHAEPRRLPGNVA